MASSRKRVGWYQMPSRSATRSSRVGTEAVMASTRPTVNQSTVYLALRTCRRTRRTITATASTVRVARRAWVSTVMIESSGVVRGPDRRQEGRSGGERSGRPTADFG